MNVDAQLSHKSLFIILAAIASIVLYIMYNRSRMNSNTEHFLWDDMHVLYPYPGMPYPGMPTTKPPTTRASHSNTQSKQTSKEDDNSNVTTTSFGSMTSSTVDLMDTTDAINSAQSTNSLTTTSTGLSTSSSTTSTSTSSTSSTSLGTSPTGTMPKTSSASSSKSSAGTMPKTSSSSSGTSSASSSESSIMQLSYGDLLKKVLEKSQTSSGSKGNSVDMSAGQWENAIKPNIPSGSAGKQASTQIVVPMLERSYPYDTPIYFEHNDKCIGVKDGKPWFNANCDLSAQQKSIVRKWLSPETFLLQVDGKCLDSNGNDVYLMECNGGDFQKWSTELKTANEENVSNILHVKSRKCLDANAEGRVYMGPCGVENGFQKFKYGFVSVFRKTLNAGESLTGKDNVLYSANQSFAAVMQTDGNFVVYRISKPWLSPNEMIASNSVFSTGTYEQFIEGFAEKKITAESLMQAGKFISGDPDPTPYLLKLEKTGELKIVSPEKKTVLVLNNGGNAEANYQLRFGLDNYVHRLELHNLNDKTIPWTSENMHVNPNHVKLVSSSGQTVAREPGRIYNSPTMFYVNHDGKCYYAVGNFFSTIKFDGDKKNVEATFYGKSSLIEACFTDMVYSIDWNKEFFVINYRYIYMIDSGKVTRIDNGYFNNIISISVNKAGNNLAIIADNVGPDFGRQYRGTVFLWFLESLDGYGPGWYYIRKDGYAIYPVKENNNNNEFEFQFRVTKVDLDEHGFNNKDLFRKLIFCGDDPGLWMTNRGYKKRYKIETDLDGNQGYGGRTAMFVGEGTVTKELVRNEWKDGDKTIRLNCLFTASRNHNTIVVCTGYDILIYYTKYVGFGMVDFLKELAIYVGIELITFGLMSFAPMVFQAMKATVTWGRVATFASTTLQKIASSGVGTSVRSLGATTSQYCRQIAAPLRPLADKTREVVKKYIGTTDDFLKLGGELGEEVVEMGVGTAVEMSWDKIYDKATSASGQADDAEAVKHAVASQYTKMVYYRYVSKFGNVFSIVDSNDQIVSETLHKSVFNQVKSNFQTLSELYSEKAAASIEKRSNEVEEQSKSQVIQSKPSDDPPKTQQNFTQEIDEPPEGFTKSTHSTLTEAYEDDPDNYNVDKSEGVIDYKDINIYELYATTIENSGDENIDKRMRRNGINKMNEIKNMVSSKDTEQNFIFLQGDYDVYLCYRSNDKNYNMMQIYRSTNLLLSIGCDIDGQRVFILKTNGLIYSARNSSSTKRDGNGAIVADDQPKFNFVLC
jgi:hypothetical protein